MARCRETLRKLVAGLVSEMFITLKKRISGDMLTFDKRHESHAKSGRKKKARKEENSRREHHLGREGPGQPDVITIRSGAHGQQVRGYGVRHRV
jgi:hypothetical protein